MSQYEMQGCHVDLEQAGPPDDDETSGMHCGYYGSNSTDISECLQVSGWAHSNNSGTLLVVAMVEEILIVIAALIPAVVLQ